MAFYNRIHKMVKQSCNLEGHHKMDTIWIIYYEFVSLIAGVIFEP